MSAQFSKTAWLSAKLKQLSLDEEIYLNYIESVVDGEEDRSEKISALEAILGDVLVRHHTIYHYDYDINLTWELYKHFYFKFIFT